jgi:ribonuclease HI
LAALSRFISRLAERALPFFKLLRKSEPFVWTDDADEAFQELKRYLTSPPIVVAAEPGEPLLLYIAATAEAMSMVLVAERPDSQAAHEHWSSSASGSGSRDPGPTGRPEAGQTAGSQLPEVIPVHGDTESQPPETALDPRGKAVMGARTSEIPPGPVDREHPEPKPMELDALNPPERVRTVQRPVYYISEVLHEANTRYMEVNKLLYAVLIASRKLRHYFQAHKISVVSSFPLRAVLHNPNVTCNIAKWAAELAEFELDFVPCHAVKSQVLADFIIDWTPPANHPEAPRCSAPEPGAPAFTEPHWTLFFDGCSRGQGAGAGVLLLAPQGDQFKYMVHLDFKATNNMAEYEALLYGLSTALSLGVRRLLVKGDSQLIIKQVRGECCCNDPQLAAYLLRARELEKDFKILDLRHIPRAENAVADDLSAKASTSAPVPDGVLERWLHQTNSSDGRSE